MGRTHGRVDLAIWADEDWAELPLPAQWLYLALISQPEINHAGLLSLTVKRWAGMAAGLDTRTVEKALEILADRRYVVIDWDAEQVLVRSFMRNDGVAKQPNTLKAACGQILLVRSPVIRAALLAELLRLDAVKIRAMRPARADHEIPYVVWAATVAALGGCPDAPLDPERVTPSDGYTREGIGQEPKAEPNVSDPNLGKGSGEGEGGSSSSVGGSVGGSRTRTHTRTREETPPENPPMPGLLLALDGGIPDRAPRCRKHDRLPADADVPPCPACGRLREQWQRDTAEAKRVAADQRATRRAACPLGCDDGWLDLPPARPDAQARTARCACNGGPPRQITDTG